MVRKKSVDVAKWPRVEEGNHSTFIHHEDGTFEHIINWDKLAEEIARAEQTILETAQPKRKKKKE